MKQTRDGLLNLRPAMKNVGEYLLLETGDRFKKQTAPDGYFSPVAGIKVVESLFFSDPESVPPVSVPLPGLRSWKGNYAQSAH